MLSLSILSVRHVLRSSFVSLLSLASLHLCLLQQPSPVCLLLPDSSILDLVLADERLWWSAEDTLIFTKLADPDIFRTGRMMCPQVFLLLATLTCGHEEFFRWMTTVFLRASHGRLALLVRILQMLGLCLLDSRNIIGYVQVRRHIWTCLGGVSAHSSRRALMHGCGCARSWPRNCTRNLRVAGKGELGRGRARFLGGLLLQKTNVFLTSCRCDGTLLGVCIGNRSRDDTWRFGLRFISKTSATKNGTHSRLLGVGHWGCLCFVVRPLPQLLEASESVLSGLLPFRIRPYLPLPGPEIPCP